jgi:hypothetical protein
MDPVMCYFRLAHSFWFLRSVESISLFPAGRRNDTRFQIWCRSWVFFFFFPSGSDFCVWTPVFVLEQDRSGLSSHVFLRCSHSHLEIVPDTWTLFIPKALYMCTPVFLLWIHKDSAFRAFLKLFCSNFCGCGVLHRSLLQESSDIVVRH